ncbi:MAG: ABC transporter permease [Actinomycetota bacterium]
MTTYLLFFGRATRRFVRSAETMISTVAFPVLLLLTMLAVFSSSVEAFEGGDYAQRLVPALVVSGIMFGSTGTAVGLFVDLESGFMQRIRSLPVPASAPLVGTVAAEVVRATAAVVVLVAIGSLAGFRFEDPIGVIGFFLVAALCAVSVTWIGLSLATRAATQETLSPPLGALFLVLLFFSEGLVPLDAYPGWAQPIVENNPATAYVTSLDALARGDALAGPLTRAVAWSIGLVAVFGTLAVRRLRPEEVRRTESAPEPVPVAEAA